MFTCVSYPGNYELLEGRGGIVLTYCQTEACRAGGSVRGWGEGKGGREKGGWVAGRTDGWMRGGIMLRNMDRRVRLSSGAGAIT